MDRDRDRTRRRGRRRRRRAAVAWGLGALLTASGVRGQATDAAVDLLRGGNLSYETNFSNPGARSLGTGGAFLGRADDATAAYANPAGLVQLKDSELSLETRSWSLPVEFGFPQPVEIDETVTGVAFLSVVYPRRRWALALYRHELTNFDARAGAPSTSSIGVVSVGYGVAAAYRFDNGLSVGAALVLYDSTLSGRAPCLTLSGPCDPELGPGDQLLVQSAEDRSVAANLGLLWRINPRWSVGAVYRRHPDLDIEGQLLTPGRPPRRLRGLALPVPDVVGLGAGLQVNSRLLLNLDLVRVLYSQFLDGFEDTTLTSPLPPMAPLGDVAFPDVTELHFGLEYSFWNVRGAPALRFGAWFDPAHRIEFRPLGAPPDCRARAPSGPTSDDALKCLLIEANAGGEDRLHVSAGFGLVLGRRFQLDVAADVSDDTETFSLSTLVRF